MSTSTTTNDDDFGDLDDLVYEIVHYDTYEEMMLGEMNEDLFESDDDDDDMFGDDFDEFDKMDVLAPLIQDFCVISVPFKHENTKVFLHWGEKGLKCVCSNERYNPPRDSRYWHYLNHLDTIDTGDEITFKFERCINKNIKLMKCISCMLTLVAKYIPRKNQYKLYSITVESFDNNNQTYYFDQIIRDN